MRRRPWRGGGGFWAGASLGFWRAVNKGRALRWRLRSRGRLGRGGRGGAGDDGGALAAFDLRRDNPIHWPRDVVGDGMSLAEVGRWDPRRLRRYGYVTDAAGFHSDDTGRGDAAARAGLLARLAANGVVVYAPDADAELRGLLGAELGGLVASDVRGLDVGERELHSIAMRRAAMREHSSWGRDFDGLPLVSILLATRRPWLLGYALASAARQTYPKLELSLTLHGDDAAFGGAERLTAGLPFPVRVTRAPAGATLGAALNAAAAASGGALLAKMDDDDCYGPEHIWDLVLARAYSGAGLVGKGVEFVYLAGADRTVHCRSGGGERYGGSSLAGGTLLAGRRDLARAGGWRDAPRGVDLALVEAVLRAGGGVYRTHGAGYILVRHGRGHTWAERDERFLAKADRAVAGWAPGLAGLAGAAWPAALGAAGAVGVV